MNTEQMLSELKEVADTLNRVKHYVKRENIDMPEGMPPVIALMMDHADLEKKVRCLTHSLTLVSQYNGRLETALKKAQADYIEANSDGETDCPTPYDVYVTVAEIKNVN